MGFCIAYFYLAAISLSESLECFILKHYFLILKSFTFNISKSVQHLSTDDVVFHMVTFVLFSLYNHFIHEFFTPALDDSLSLKSKWQHVFSGLQDSSQYYSWCQQCYSLYSFNSRTNCFWIILQTFGCGSKHINYNWYFLDHHISTTFFSFVARSKYMSIFSFSLIFSLWSARTARSIRRHILFIFLSFSFLLINTRSGLLIGIRWSMNISKYQWIICCY